MIPESDEGRQLSVFTVGGVFLAIRNPRARGPVLITAPPRTALTAGAAVLH
jgi:hypothetical protein